MYEFRASMTSKPSHALITLPNRYINSLEGKLLASLSRDGSNDIGGTEQAVGVRGRVGVHGTDGGQVGSTAKIVVNGNSVSNDVGVLGGDGDSDILENVALDQDLGVLASIDSRVTARHETLVILIFVFGGIMQTLNIDEVHT